MMDGDRSSPSPDWKKDKKRPKDISKFISIGVVRWGWGRAGGTTQEGAERKCVIWRVVPACCLFHL